MFTETTETHRAATGDADPAVPPQISVLVVDDRHDRWELMRRVLESADPRVTVVGFAADTELAVETIGRLHPAVAVVAVGGSIEVDTARVAALREAASDLRIIASSFRLDPAVVEAVIASGADGHIAKPFGLRDLREVIVGATVRPGG